MKAGGPPPCPFAKRFPSELQRDDSYFMALAFNEALKAWDANEVPIGAVIAINGIAVARAFNRVEALKDPTAHAEILAITAACNAIGDWRLNEATLYVTKEPCPMCAGATIMSRVGSVCFAVADPKMGCMGGATPLHSLPDLNHRVQLRPAVLTEDCRALIQAWFQLKRQSP